jgi:hypothetical protein
MALPGVARGNFSLNQAALFEVAQHAAQIAGVEIKRAGDRFVSGGCDDQDGGWRRRGAAAQAGG